MDRFEADTSHIARQQVWKAVEDLLRRGLSRNSHRSDRDRSHGQAEQELPHGASFIFIDGPERSHARRYGMPVHHMSSNFFHG
jgi:hypothetical protein